jgi:PAS domain S-box-containing protein
VSPRPLSSFLARLIWLSMAPLLLLAVWLAFDSLQSREAAHRREGANLAKNFATTIDQFLRARINALNMLAVSPLADDPRRWRELYAEAQGFRESFGSHVIFADLERQMLFYTRMPYGTVLPKLPLSKGRSAAPLALETGRPQVGDIVFGLVAKVPLVAIVAPGLRDGKVAHLMLSPVETTLLQRRLDDLALPAGWSLALIDGTGADIARRSPPGFDAARDVEPDHRFVVGLQRSHWSVVLEIPRSSHRSELARSMAFLVAAILLATLLGLLGGTLASRRLARQMRALAEPPGADAPPSEIAEIAVARREIDSAAATRNESEARFRRLFHEAPLPLCSVNKGGELADRNRRFDHLFGYSHEELRSLDDWWRLAYPEPDYRAWVVDTWNAAVAEAARKGSDIAPVEYVVTCKDGTRRTMLISGITLGEDFLATFFDVTEHRQAERTQAQALAQQQQARLAALNQMEDANTARASAEAAAAEIRRLNANLERRVDERTAELSAANQELDAFAYAVTHDLRAPLRAMSGFSQALEEDFGDRLSGEAKTYLDQISLASRKMNELIDGILTLSRSTRGGMRRDPVDLSEMASRLLEQLAQAEPGRQVAVEVADGLLARGDARMLEAALANLLGNAWKYTARTAEARIRVYAEARGDSRWFCVADNGAGFDMAHAERLFKPFQRLHRQDEFPGIGIGLATVQRIIQRHGGRIEARGEPGKGAVFCFTLAESASSEGA